MAILAAGALFFVFALNVALGAVTGSPLFGDIPEMLVLFAASICFVAAILRREAENRNSNQQ